MNTQYQILQAMHFLPRMSRSKTEAGHDLQPSASLLLLFVSSAHRRTCRVTYAPVWLRADVSTAPQWSPAHAAESTVCASGDESSIQQAVLKGSHKKLQWILECLLGNLQLPEIKMCIPELPKRLWHSTTTESFKCAMILLHCWRSCS